MNIATARIRGATNPDPVPGGTILKRKITPPATRSKISVPVLILINQSMSGIKPTTVFMCADNQLLVKPACHWRPTRAKTKCSLSFQEHC
ncbi:MAG TPA: hypothetical protein VFV68_03765, partial [Agriterribacter sp.]|nr:hypothetical protein [Agriterribacter sp.]